MLRLTLALLSISVILAAESPRPSQYNGCSVIQQKQQLLTLGTGAKAYVEPSTIASTASRSLLAGYPIFLSKPTHPADNRPQPFGVSLGRHGSAQLLEAPMTGVQLRDMRAAANDDGTWSVTFAEVRTGSSIMQDAPVSNYWFGRTDGRHWTNLEKLPLAKHDYKSYSASKLVLSRHRIIVAIPYYDSVEGGVEVFQRSPSGIWTSTEMRSRSAYVALDTTVRGDLLLGIVRADTTERTDSNSLFLYLQSRDSTTWSKPHRIVRGGNEPVKDLTLDWLGGELFASWIVSGMRIDGTEARTLRLYPEGSKPSEVISLKENVDQNIPLAVSGAPPVWLLVEPSADSAKLFLLSLIAGVPKEIWRSTVPSQGIASATAVASEVRIITPRIVRPRVIAVTSHMTDVTISCTR
jgi:hypothetical protein